jgi:DNA-binding GntR family transcriptional regulator
MKGILTQIDELLKSSDVDVLEYSKLDLELHALPIVWTRNDKLYRLYQSQNFQWYMTRLGKSNAGQQEHWCIYNAYASGDIHAVKKAITAHIEAGKVSVIACSNKDSLM